MVHLQAFFRMPCQSREGPRPSIASTCSVPFRGLSSPTRIVHRCVESRISRVALGTFVETPGGATAKGSAAIAPPRLRFAVQKHQARSLHYDFRLEIEGVLVSWAVPKGPSKDPKVRRLAMRVPDHPLDYLLFEGSPPEGEDGAGDVIVWDFGEYELVAPEGYGAGAALRDGALRFALYGTKLKGDWAIFRTTIAGGGREHWLLEKLRDEFAETNYDPESEPNSALSSRALRIRR